eukprot:CAMPEP_0204915136 /NCGR_PEP_ID=MMETSP1397-20131031/13162_1 /ASSEMBLY_ACC=CAM_ASM_000891 /TAXON_ID=49980 /ORGANISM="Climacostomum Climacostomum virens, Strain Stock W-24" /LENGTH=624 /DNA_ID=CAMNT_0052087043 /DNA_START=340 /DNA_END=2214 /DNA_ORIENTATION=-
MNDHFSLGQLPSLTFALNSDAKVFRSQFFYGEEVSEGISWENFSETTGLQGKYFTFILQDAENIGDFASALEALGILHPAPSTAPSLPQYPPTSQHLIATPTRGEVKVPPLFPDPAPPSPGHFYMEESTSQAQPIMTRARSKALKAQSGVSDPLDEVRHLYTLDQLMYISFSQLYVHNSVTDSKDFIQADTILALVKHKALTYSLDVIFEGEKKLSTFLRDEFAFQADEDNHTISWLHFTGDACVCYIALVSSSITPLVALLPRLSFEVFRGEPIEETEEYWFSSCPTERSEKFDAFPTLNWGDAFEIEMEGSLNHLTTQSLRSNLSLVASDSLLSLYRTDIDDLSCLSQIRILDGRKLAVPTCLTIQTGDRFGNLGANDKLFLVDLERGSVVRKWEGRTWTGLCPDSHESCVVGVTRNGMYLLDSRSKTDAIKKEYTGNPSFTCVSGFSASGLAVGTEKGEIRLYKELGQNSKTNFPHVGSKIRAIDVSHDKCWVLATTKSFLLLVPTSYKNLSGFRDRLGKNKQPPLRLNLIPTDVSKCGLSSIDFTPAHFEKFEAEPEHSITTSTGPYLIVWNFESIKRGFLTDYTMKDMRSGIVSTATQPSQPHIVVTMQRHLKVQSRLS